MARTTLIFSLTDVTKQRDLLIELALHEGVEARAEQPDPAPLIVVEMIDTPAMVWDVRATVGIFDEGAVEVTVRAGGS